MTTITRKWNHRTGCMDDVDIFPEVRRPCGHYGRNVFSPGSKAFTEYEQILKTIPCYKCRMPGKRNTWRGNFQEVQNP